MTRHTYAVGDSVCISSDPGRAGAFDKITRITAASVITENSGAFRLASRMYDDRLTRNATGVVYSTHLFPEHHQQYDAAKAHARMTRRKAAVIGSRIPGGIAEPIQTWINDGTDAAYLAMTDYLHAAHAKNR